MILLYICVQWVSLISTKLNSNLYCWGIMIVVSPLPLGLWTKSKQWIQMTFAWFSMQLNNPLTLEFETNWTIKLTLQQPLYRWPISARSKLKLNNISILNQLNTEWNISGYWRTNIAFLNKAGNLGTERERVWERGKKGENINGHGRRQPYKAF